MADSHKTPDYPPLDEAVRQLRTLLVSGASGISLFCREGGAVFVIQQVQPGEVSK